MNRKLQFAIFVLAAALLFPLKGMSQQQTGGSAEPQTAGSGSSGQGTENQPAQQTAVGPVSSSPVDLSGPESFTPGTSGEQLNYFLPSMQVSEMADSNSTFGTGTQHFESVERVGGRLALQHVERHGVTTADYMGTGVFYNNESGLDTSLHELGVTQTYRGARWNLALDDRASYTPESAYGSSDFGWGGGLGLSLGGALGSNLASLNPAFNPSQSLYSNRGDRISNVTDVSLGYVLSARSSMNIGGSYGLLHIMTPGAIDSTDSSVTLGYNRLISARDTIGVSYGAGFFRFRHVGEHFDNHVIQFEYGHRLTGRLSMEAGGGPQLSVFHTVAGSTTLTSWNARTSFNYQRARNAFALSFSRYASNGGGVFVGAQTDNVQFSWARSLGRRWSGSIGPGYAYNQSFRQTTAGNASSSYNSYYVTASLSRSVGRYMSMFLTYNLEGQTFHAGACTSGNCSSSLLRHVFSFGFDWHPRQLVID